VPNPLDITELTVMIGTDRPDELARFYGEALGLPRAAQYKDPVFRAGNTNVRILRHSQVHGANPTPARHILNLFIGGGGVAAQVERLRALGVPVVREPEREFWGGLVATLQDPDGNYVQLIEGR
jgi:catechol 2,3-dioxygenase-like lactoylglutathione lyase family enzyme